MLNERQERVVFVRKTKINTLGNIPFEGARIPLVG